MATIWNSTLERRTPLARGSSKVTLNCKACGNPFDTWPYRIRAGVRACSMKCAGVLKRNRSPHNCSFCGKQFERSVSQVFHRGAKYCSRECSNKGYVAECAQRPIRDKYGRSARAADRAWQKAVRERDAYTCQRCGKVEKYVHAHHVATRSRRPDLRHDISNGKCLCGSCHSWVHEHPKEALAAGLLSGDSYELARKKLSGADHPMAKLTAPQIVVLRQRRLNGEAVQDLAKEFGLHRATVSRIVNGHVY